MVYMDKKQEYFNSIAEDWDKDFTAEDIERLVHIIDKINVTKGVTVCDMGCGTGVMFDMLRRRVGEDGYIVGVDFAPRVAHRAMQNFPFHNIGVVEACAEALPFYKDNFDLVISFAAFAHFRKQGESIHQAYHILKPGGRLVIIHLYGREELERQHHEVGGPIDDDKLPDRDHLAEMFQNSHFERFELTETQNLYLAIGYKD